MFQYALTLHDGELTDDEVAAIREFYRPVAELITTFQLDLREVLDSTRIKFATEEALDMICQLIGVNRYAATPSEGQQRFYYTEAKSTDTVIPSGLLVQTEGTNPIVFRTVEEAIIPAGTLEAFAAVEAVEPGNGGNVGPGFVNEFGSFRPDPELLTENPESFSGGRDKEDDDNLRERAMDELSSGAKATAPAIISAVSALPATQGISLFVNDEPTDGKHGLPSGAMELVVDYDGDMQDVVDCMIDTKAACAPMLGGVNGTLYEGVGRWPNGQTIDIQLSIPNEVLVYVNAEIVYKPDIFPGVEAVENAIIDYIGGYRNDGELVKNGLRVGEDVIVGEIEYAMRSVDGVYDVNWMNAAQGQEPSSDDWENIPISTADLANADARPGSSTLNIFAVEQTTQ